METEGDRNPFILAGATIYFGDRMLAKQLGKKVVLTQTLILEATKIPIETIMSITKANGY